MERYLFKVYNIPKDKGDNFIGLVNQFTDVKNIWIARDNSGVSDAWAWVEFHSKDDMTITKSYINGLIWHSHKLLVLE